MRDATTATSLHTVESALFVLCLDALAPATDMQVWRVMALCGWMGGWVSLCVGGWVFLCAGVNVCPLTTVWQTTVQPRTVSQ